MLGVKAAIRWQIMKQGPDNLVREALIEPLNLGLVEIDTLETVADLAGQLFKIRIQRPVPVDDPWPADPHTTAIPQNGHERTDKPTAAGRA